jgi:hypothetical protein
MADRGGRSLRKKPVFQAISGYFRINLRGEYFKAEGRGRNAERRTAESLTHQKTVQPLI